MRTLEVGSKRQWGSMVRWRKKGLHLLIESKPNLYPSPADGQDHSTIGLLAQLNVVQPIQFASLHARIIFSTWLTCPWGLNFISELASVMIKVGFLTRKSI